MEIRELRNRADLAKDKRLDNIYKQFDKLLTELKKKELSEVVIKSINDGVDQVNAVSGADRKLRNQVRMTQSEVLKFIEIEMGLVAKNHYRNTWMAIGMTAIGIPMGVVFGMSLGNIAFMGIGLPIGLAIGVAVGTGLDKKALEEGRQIDFEIKH